MKKTICLTMVIVLTLCMFSSIITMVANTIKTMDTPIAKIPNDTYVPFSEKDREMQSAYALAQEIKAIGGSADIYASEEEYEKERDKKYASSRTLVSDVSFKPVKQTITVMTTATGSKDNGNYIASKPIPNAIVRIDGVPRYTDRKGQIHVTITREYVELFAEKEDYNPYIEFMDVTGDEKIIHMKKQSDDIDIYAANISYLGTNINVLNNKCFINKNLFQRYADISVYSNLYAEKYYLLVNGKKRFYSSSGLFKHINFNEFEKTDKFAIQAYYNGIESKIYDLNIKVVSPYVNLATLLKPALDNMQNHNVGFGDDNIQDMGRLDTEFTKTIIEFLGEQINKGGTSINVGPASIEYNYLFNPNTGDIRYTLGFSFEFQTKKIKELEHKLNKKFIENKEREKKVKDAEREIVDIENKIDDLNRQLYYDKITKDQYIEEKNKALKKLNDSIEYYESPDCYDPMYKELEEEIDSIWDEIDDAEQKYNNEVESKTNQIENLVKDIDKGYADIDSIKNMMTKLPECKNKIKSLVGMLKNDPPYGQSFSAKLELQLIGAIIYNCDTEQVKQVIIAGGAKLKVSYTYQTVLWAIPCYVKVTADGGVQLEFKVNPRETMNVTEFIKGISIVFEASVRLDLGVGVSGVASISVFGKIGLSLDFSFGHIINGMQPFQIDFNYGYGMRFEFLWFNHEISHYDKLQIVERTELNSVYAEANLMARSDGMKNISKNQVLSNVFQNSTSKLIEYNGERILFWLEDSIERDDYNRTILKYSVLKNNIWAAPTSINNDGKADLNFDVIIHNGDLYVAYQKSNRIFSADDQIENVLSSQEIFISKYNHERKVFDHVQLSDNASMDVKPQFSICEDNEDQLAVIWQSNSHNDAFGMTGINSIYASYLNEVSWTTPNKVYETDKIIRGSSATIKNEVLNVALAIDNDDDIMTFDCNIMVVNTSGQVIFKDELATNPIFTIVDGKVTLFYAVEKKLIKTDLNQTFEVCDIESIGDNYNLFTSGKDIYLTYEKVAGDYKQAFCSKYEYDSNHWTFDIPLTQESGNVTNTFATILGGELIVGYNLKDEEYNTSLCISYKQFSTGLQINKVNCLEGLSDGKKVELCILLTNTGAVDINKLNFKVFNQSINVDLSNELKVGTSDYYNITIDVKYTYNSNEALVVSALGSDNAILAQSSFEIVTTFTDIALEAEAYVRNGVQNFAITLSNISLYDAVATLNVYCNGKKIDSIECFIENGKTYFFDLEYTKLKENDYIYFEVITDREDANSVDNSIGIYSIQDYVEPYNIVENKYIDSLRTAKGLL